MTDKNAKESARREKIEKTVNIIMNTALVIGTIAAVIIIVLTKKI